MGTDRTNTDGFLMGFGLPIPLTVWDAQSSFTEANPVPAAVLADRTTNLQLVASGTPDNADTLDIEAQHGGLPGGAGRILHRATGGNWLGHDPPSIVTRLQYLNSSSVTVSMAATATTVLVAREYASGGTSVVDVYEYDPATGTYSIAAASVVTDAQGYELLPELVALPDGTVELYYSLRQGDSATIAKMQSLDNGATWEDGGKGLLDATLDTSSLTPLKIRVAASGAQHLMVVQWSDLSVDQFWSADGGARFTEVASSFYTSVRLCDVVYLNGWFMVLWWCDEVASSFQKLVVQRLGSASQGVNHANSIDIVSPTAGISIHQGADDDADYSAALIAEESGRLWVYFWVSDASAFQDETRWWCATSTDAGLTWGAPVIWYGGVQGGAVGSSWKTLRARWFRGQTHIVMEASQTYTGTLGGWTNATHPPRQVRNGLPDYIATCAAVFCPVAQTQPDSAVSADWAYTNSGSPTIVAGALGYMKVTGAAATDFAQWQHVLFNGYTQHAIGGFTATPLGTDGVQTLTLACVPPGATTTSFGLLVIYDEELATLSMVDEASATTIASVAIPAGEVEIIAGVIADEDVSGAYSGWCAYRLTATGPEVRDFTVLGKDTLTDASTAHTYSEAIFRCDTGAALAWDTATLWLWANIGDGTAGSPRVAYGLLHDYYSPGWGNGVEKEELNGRTLASRPVYLQDGQSVQALGVVRKGDAWSHAPGHTYAVENALPLVLATPKRGFRSTTDTSSQLLAFQRLTADAPSRAILALYLDGCNFRAFQTRFHTGGAWSLSLNWTPETYAYESFGGVIIPNFASYSDGTASEWFDEDELAGCTFEFADGTIRRISGNRAGAWGSDDQVTPILYLEGVTGAEPTGTGTGYIWFDRHLALIHLPDPVTEWRGFSVEFDYGAFGDTVDGDIRCDVLALCEVLVPGLGPDETRAVAREIGPELVDLPNGEMFERLTRGDRRRVEISWTQARPNYNTQDWSHDYVIARTSGPAVGDVHDALPLIDGMIKRHGRKPLLYIPKIPIAAGAQTHYRGREAGAIYGRITNATHRIESARGHAEVMEDIRGGVLTIVEEGR